MQPVKHNEWFNILRTNVDQEILDALKAKKHGGWSENYISTRVLTAIERSGTELHWEDLRQKVVWEGLKLSGSLETTFGDIAVFVRVWLTSDRYVDGVAFYEAKRQYFNDKGEPAGFSSLNLEQLSRIHQATHASNVLLYDADIASQRGCASSLPTRFAEEMAAAKLASSTGRILHHYGKHWLNFLADNLKGFGLDFSPQAVQQIKNLATDTATAPFAIMNASAGLVGQDPALDPYFAHLPHYERLWGQEIEREMDDDTSPSRDGPSIG